MDPWVYLCFFGWHTTHHDVVFHVGSDLLFGRGSRTWVAEALDMLERRPDVLMCSPLPGRPTTTDGELTPDMVAAHSTDDGSGPVREGGPWLSSRMASVSTRLFPMDGRSLARSRNGSAPW